jgi:hypothetical protein
MRKHLALVAVAATPFLALAGASSAWAAACITDPVSVYTAPGFSCNVGPVTFSHISVTPSVSGSGSVTLTDFIPFMTVVDGAEEYGLDLTYTSSTGTTPDSAADVAWIYDVSGVPHLTDAFASLAGTSTGTGSIDVSETLTNGASLSLLKAGSTSTMFAAITSLGVTKDQSDLAGTAGSSDSSILGNGFSVGTIPEPSTWVMMLLGFAGLGYAGLRKSKKQRLAIG